MLCLYVIEMAAGQGADFICFPEIQLTPFFPQYEKLDASGYSVTLESSYVKEMCALCRELNIYASTKVCDLSNCYQTQCLSGFDVVFISEIFNGRSTE